MLIKYERVNVKKLSVNVCVLRSACLEERVFMPTIAIDHWQNWERINIIVCYFLYFLVFGFVILFCILLLAILRFSWKIWWVNNNWRTQIIIFHSIIIEIKEISLWYGFKETKKACKLIKDRFGVDEASMWSFQILINHKLKKWDENAHKTMALYSYIAVCNI